MNARSSISQLRIDADPITAPTNAASKAYRTPSSRPTWRKSTALPLYRKLELRAITNKSEKRDNSVIMSSEIPSAKYSCSGSPPAYSRNARTAIDGLSGSASGGRRRSVVEPYLIDPHRPRNIFQLLFADIFKCDVKFILRIFSHTVRHTDAARLAKCLEPEPRR